MLDFNSDPSERTVTSDDYARIKQGVSISEVASWYAHLRPVGDGYMANCFLGTHSDRNASFHIVENGGDSYFKCHGCGEGGDVIKLVQLAEGHSTAREAAISLSEKLGPFSDKPKTQHKKLAPAQHKKLEVAGSLARGKPILGTPAENFLKLRGLKAEDCQDIFFDDNATHGSRAVPAIVAVLRDRDGHDTGAQFNYLSDDGAERLNAEPNRRNFGAVKGSCVQLYPPSGNIWGLAEGIETAIAAHMLSGYPVWACLGATNMISVPPPDWAEQIVIFADNDATGRRAAEEYKRAVLFIGRQCWIEHPKRGKDFNDDVLAGRQSIFDANGRFRILDWDASRFTGKPPDYEWLIENVCPLGTAGILAARGDTGKGFLTLDLALKVSCWPEEPAGLTEEYPRALGNNIRTRGTVVMLTAEDSKDEIHRRIVRIDPMGYHERRQGRLYIIPMPNAGGPCSFVDPTRGEGSKITDAWFSFRDQVLQLHDVKLIVIDPLSSFIYADVNKDPHAAAFVDTLMAELAAETGACVLVCHHMNKGISRDEIWTLEESRDWVRGTGAINDGVRWLFTVWPVPVNEAKKIAKRLDLPWANNLVYWGGVAKSNAAADREKKVFIRDLKTGLLIDRTESLRNTRFLTNELEDMMIAAIAVAATTDTPFTKTGAGGVWDNRHRLPEELRDLHKEKLENIVQELLNKKRIQTKKINNIRNALDARNSGADI